MRMTWMLSAAVAIIAVAFGCSSAPREPATRCALAAADSVYLDGGPVFRDCAVDRKAKMMGTPRFDFTPQVSANSRTNCYAVEVQFVVAPDGMPEWRTARFISSNDAGLERAILAALPSWRFEPAQRDGVPVRQIVSQRLSAALVVVRATGPGAVRPPSRPPNCS